MPAPSTAGEATAACVPSELWIDKHAPRSTEDLLLALHKRKLAEVHDWMEAQLPANHRRSYCRLMVVTGPPGCGKTCTVRVVAGELGFDVVEWTPPAPTLWTEHRYQAADALGTSYVSKLDEFDAFVARAKFPALVLAGPPPAASAGAAASAASAPSGLRAGGPGNAPPEAPPLPPTPGARPPTRRCKLVLVEDLPHASDATGRTRVTNALRDLASTARFPVVLITTDAASATSGGPESGASAASGSAKGLHKDTLEALTRAGAVVVTFNQVTPANVVKVLARVAEREHVQLSNAAAAAVAAAAAGDVRNAVTTLQVLYQARSTAADGGGDGGGIGGLAKARGAPAKVRRSRLPAPAFATLRLSLPLSPPLGEGMGQRLTKHL
eukprot:363169-Chlamydomonas_euryale.AAC.3